MSKGHLTTHVLDLTSGKPAVGIKIELWIKSSAPEVERTLLKTLHTNADGRTDEPLLSPGNSAVGDYELIFFVGDYFQLPEDDRFLDRVPIFFRVGNADAHYHVPLLTTPWAYQTYRGS